MDEQNYERLMSRCTPPYSKNKHCQKLRKLGYTRAYALKGGINAWQGDGMPVTSK